MRKGKEKERLREGKKKEGIGKEIEERMEGVV